MMRAGAAPSTLQAPCILPPSAPKSRARHVPSPSRVGSGTLLPRIANSHNTHALCEQRPGRLAYVEAIARCNVSRMLRRSESTIAESALPRNACSALPAQRESSLN